jgi:hypothetical protein
VLAQISYSRVFKLLFRFCNLLIRLIVIKSVAEKKKKNPKIFMSLIINGAAYIIIVTVSFVFILLFLFWFLFWFLFLFLFLVSCFLDLITSWDKTRSYCLD